MLKAFLNHMLTSCLVFWYLSTVWRYSLKLYLFGVRQVVFCVELLGLSESVRQKESWVGLFSFLLPQNTRVIGWLLEKCSFKRQIDGHHLQKSRARARFFLAGLTGTVGRLATQQSVATYVAIAI